MKVIAHGHISTSENMQWTTEFLYFNFIYSIIVLFPPGCGLHVCIALFILDFLSIFQIFQSVLTESIQVFFGLPRPRSPFIFISMACLIELLFLSTWPYQGSLLCDSKFDEEGIICLFRRELESKRSVHLTLHLQRIILLSQQNSVRNSGRPALTGI